MAGLSLPSSPSRLRTELGAAKVIDDRQELRTYECDGLAHYKVVPGAGRAGRDHRDVAAVVRPATRPACRSWRAAPAPACPAARCRTPTACSSSRRGCADPRGRPRRPARGGRAGRHQPRTSPGPRRAARLLLRARPVQPAGLLDRRQRRGELRRRALPEVRLHHQPRARRRGRRRRTARWSSSAARPPTRPATTCSARSSAPRARSASPPR